MVAAAYNGATSLTQHINFPQQPSLLPQTWGTAGLAAAGAQAGTSGGVCSDELFRIDSGGALYRQMPPGLEASLATAAEWSSANAWDVSAAPSWLILSACNGCSSREVCACHAPSQKASRCSPHPQWLCRQLFEAALTALHEEGPAPRFSGPHACDCTTRWKALQTLGVDPLAALPRECLASGLHGCVQAHGAHAQSGPSALSPLAQRAADAAVRVAAGLLSPGRWKAPQAVGVSSMAALHKSASLPKNSAPYKSTYKAMSPIQVHAC